MACDDDIILLIQQVTTPQGVALVDVRREATFCRKAKLTIIGIVENMSGFVCPHCAECTNLFSSGGGEKLASGKQIFVSPPPHFWLFFIRVGTKRSSALRFLLQLEHHLKHTRGCSCSALPPFRAGMRSRLTMLANADNADIK